RGGEAQNSLEAGLRLARELQETPIAAQMLNFRGDSFFYRGDLKSARPLFEQARREAAGTADRHLILLSELNVLKVAVQEGRSRSALRQLQALARAAEDRGLEYLALECSGYSGEAPLTPTAYSQTRHLPP